uniref:Uncharacterized protein n=1 Tax=Ditylenchus dipsaci TaxID=166011 RepID=A0A915DX99_9BILA
MSSKKDHRKGSGMSGQPPHSPAKKKRFDSPEKNDDAPTSSSSVATDGKVYKHFTLKSSISKEQNFVAISVMLTRSPKKRYTSTLLSSTETAASVVDELSVSLCQRKELLCWTRMLWTWEISLLLSFEKCGCR